MGRISGAAADADQRRKTGASLRRVVKLALPPGNFVRGPPGARVEDIKNS
jgi:hypothetical protein